MTRAPTLPLPGMPTRTCIGDGTYRWALREGLPGPALVWIMLNPSTADKHKDDPTIRKVRGFTARYDHAAWAVVNLYPFRATSPRELLIAVRDGRAMPPYGPGHRTVDGVLATADAIVLAWGANARIPEIGRRAASMTEAAKRSGRPLFTVGPLLPGGIPRHPLMAPYGLGLVPFDGKHLD